MGNLEGKTQNFLIVRGMINRLLSFERRVSTQALADFFDHLSILLASGIPLLQALEFINKATKNRTLSHAIGELLDTVRSGARFSEALTHYPHVFNHVVLGMIKAAETSGSLELVCRELARSFAQSAELRNRITQALAYPAVIAVAGIATVCVLVVFVVPKLAVVFELWDAPLPLMTQLLLGFSSFMSKGGFFALTGLILFLIVFMRLIRPRLGCEASLVLMTKTPFLKDLFFLNDFVHLTRTWGMLLRSGVPIVGAIRSAKDVLWNLEIKTAMNDLEEKVLRGVRFEEAVQDIRWFPELAKSFLSIGATSGTLDQSFDKVAFYYERELDRKLKLAATLLEPLLILSIGLIVGALVTSLLVPIFEMSLIVQ
jgi:type IV pilus assembly protein PilC